MVHFPAWLPAPIAKHAAQLLGSGAFEQDPKGRARLVRLACDPGMQTVWKALSRAASDDTALVDFLDQVRLHPTVLGPPLPSSGLSPAQQRSAFKRIARLAHRLLHELQQLGGSTNSAQSGLALLEGALGRAERKALFESSGGAFPLLSLPVFAEDDEDPPSPVEVLTLLARSAELAASAPPPPGPRKLKARSAPRTAYIQDISSFVQRRFRKPLPSAVAATISVSLEDAEVTEDLVRKLTGTKRNISGNKSK